MSYQPSHSTEHMPPPPAQAEEGIHWFAVIGTGVGSVIVFTIAVLIVFRMMHAREKALQPQGPMAAPTEIGQNEINIVDQVPFGVSRAVQGYRRSQLERLESWGWIDRKAGTVHMPIGDAIDLVVKENHR